MVKDIKEMLEKIGKIEAWSIDLVKISLTKTAGIKYNAEELSNFDNDGISRLVKNVSNLYTVGKELDKYRNLEKYDGTLMTDVIYEMNTTNELIKNSYKLFINALANPDNENEPISNKYDCYILKSSIEEAGEDIPIKLIFMCNPIKILRNKYIKINDKYTEITNKVISLKLSIDMLVWNDKIFFFNNSGERLFNMERTYKIICQKHINEIVDNAIISDIESFKMIANSGYNPRRFISFNKENLEMLKDNIMKNNIASHFGIPLVDGKFDTANPEVSEKLIKLLCDKGKLDPFNNKPVEVAGAKEWV